jgi:hypothetical protein
VFRVQLLWELVGAKDMDQNYHVETHKSILNKQEYHVETLPDMLYKDDVGKANG